MPSPAPTPCAHPAQPRPQSAIPAGQRPAAPARDMQISGRRLAAPRGGSGASQKGRGRAALRGGCGGRGALGEGETLPGFVRPPQLGVSPSLGSAPAPHLPGTLQTPLCGSPPSPRLHPQTKRPRILPLCHQKCGAGSVHQPNDSKALSLSSVMLN